LAAVVLTPAAAQDGEFTETEQAALDETRIALEHFVNLNTYSANITQQTMQDIGMTYLGQNVRLEQAVDAQGTLQVEKVAGGGLDNQRLSLTETVSQHIIGGGGQDSEVGPIQLELIVLDDRIYMRLKIESDVSGMLPPGWVDVTDGAEMFPGMNMFDIRQVMQFGVIESNFVTALFEAVIAIDIQEPTEVDGRTVNHYCLELDPVLALESLGVADLESMFDSNALPFDVAKLIDLIYTDDDTTFMIDFGVGADDQMLYDMTQFITMDLTIGPDLITDPTLKDAEMTMLQTSTQSYQFYGFDEPVTISAPELAK
jgi:hypothetical protein